MTLRNLNLNLLIHLDALLEHRSVSKAAEQLELGQPTVSAALARLRRHFGDELLHRVGNRYELTPLGGSLRPVVADALLGAERVFMNQAAFDPATSRREFTLVTGDYWVETIGPLLSRVVAAEAPNTALRFHLLRSEHLDRPVDALQKFDGALVPHGLIRGAPHVDLVTTEWRCLVSPDNPLVGETLAMEDLAALPWVVYTDRSSASLRELTSLVIRQLRLSGFAPRVAVEVQTFGAVPHFIMGTDRVGVVHRSLAERMGAATGLRVLEPPFAYPPLTQAFWWHPHRNHDTAHRWLRAQLARVAVEMIESDQGFGPPASLGGELRPGGSTSSGTKGQGGSPATEP